MLFIDHKETGMSLNGDIQMQKSSMYPDRNMSKTKDTFSEEYPEYVDEYRKINNLADNAIDAFQKRIDLSFDTKNEYIQAIESLREGYNHSYWKMQMGYLYDEEDQFCVGEYELQEIGPHIYNLSQEANKASFAEIKRDTNSDSKTLNRDMAGYLLWNEYDQVPQNINEEDEKIWNDYEKAQTENSPDVNNEWDEYSQKTDIARAKAIDKAWEKEVERVKKGKGTWNWTVEQQAELLHRGRVSGFEGSHMLNVKDYPEHAGNPDNIQFLPVIAHFDGVHKRDAVRNNPNGRYNPDTGEIESVEDGKVPELREIDLTDRYVNNEEQQQFNEAYTTLEQSGMGRRQGYLETKNRHPEKSIKNRPSENEEKNSEQFPEQDSSQMNYKASTMENTR